MAQPSQTAGESAIGLSSTGGGLGVTVSLSDELLYCVKNYVDLYGDTVDPQELLESLQKGHGFDVDLDTVKWALETLRRKPKIIYGEEYKDYTKLDNGSDAASPADGGVDQDAAADGGDLASISALLSQHATTSVDAAAGFSGRRKIKLTHEILNIVASTLDEESEVHSLLSLKRVLERKGIFISKTSVYRALEKLGRSIIEKKKGRRHIGGPTMTNLPTSTAASKGPLDLSVKPSTAATSDSRTQPGGPMTVAQMLEKRSGKPKNIRRPSRRKVVAEMLDKKKNKRDRQPSVMGAMPPGLGATTPGISATPTGMSATPPAAPAQQLLAVTAGGQTMLLSGHVIPPRKLRALLPKPSPSQTLTSMGLSAATTSSSGVDSNQSVLSPGIPIQMNREGVAIPCPVNVIPVPNVVRTPKILNVTGSPSPAYTPPNTATPPTIPSRSSPVDATVRTPVVNEKVVEKVVKKEEDRVDEAEVTAPPPMVKIEIDDPAYRTEEAEDLTTPTWSTIPFTMTTHTPVLSTITPPPRIEHLHTSGVTHLAAERLTKSVSPQLLARSSLGTSLGEEKTHDVRGRAIQQFRLNKAIGKIANMKSQGQAVRTPRKPSVVFHRPSSNGYAIPFKVRDEPPGLDFRRREGRILAGRTKPSTTEDSVLAQFGKIQRYRAFQLRAARTAAQQRSALVRGELHKLHPTALTGRNGKIVTSLTGTRKRVAAREQKQKFTSPLYYQPDRNDEEFVPELEIDPPGVNQDEINVLMRQSLIEMTQQMRKLSDHMETIQGQLQCIVELLPGMHPRYRDRRPATPEQPLNMSNGHMRPSSPLSNEEQSLDSDDCAAENGGMQQELAIDFKDLPPLGTPESDVLIKEVMDDHRWDQMTAYAGAPRLAISLARYCVFGTKVLMESSVTGRNSKNPLDHGAMRKIKELLQEKYGHRCNQLEFEMVWKTSRESISQLCKRLRRKFQLVESMRLNGESPEDFIIDYKQ